MSGTYFITGVTGFVGQEVMSLLCADGAEKIYCFARASKDLPAETRLKLILSDLDIPDDGRVALVEGDIRKERMGIEDKLYEEICASVTHIIHSAADVRFNRPLEKMRRINVDGTRHVLRLAKDCLKRNPDFSHVSYVSTTFVAGRRSGVVKEDELNGEAGFKNTYELTKYEAEVIVRSWMGEIPIIIYRPSIVMGASETGRAKKNNVVYPLLRLLTNWNWPVISVNNRTTMDVVPVDFVAKAMLHISKDPENYGKCFHLAAGTPGDMPFREFFSIVKEVFGKRVINIPPILWRLVVRPLLMTFKRSYYEKSTGIFRAFTSYIWEYNPRFSVDEAKEALADSGVKLPDTTAFLRVCFKRAIETDFGRKEE